MPKPMVSVITPVHNSRDFVGEAIRSVQAQTLIDWEMIVVDDCSTDDSVEIVERSVHEDDRIRLIQLETNSGAAMARNIAIEATQGRYIAFLDSDDLWLPEKLKKQLAFMQANNYPFTYAAYDKIDENGQVFGHLGVPRRVSYSDLLKTCSIGCLTSMYDTQYFGKVYMPNILKRQDFGLWLELLKRTKYAYGLNERLAQYRVRSNSISSNKLSAAQYTWRLYRDVEKLNFLKSSYYFSHYALRGLLRTKAPALARKLGVLHLTSP
jgi:teichuronic acid biosynthesis glycosyltransferase TuaG